MAKVKYNFTNAKPPRGYRSVPVTLEENAKKILTSLIIACGERSKLREAEMKFDLKGKKPIIGLKSRFYRKHSKSVEFPISLEQLGLASPVDEDLVEA